MQHITFVTNVCEFVTVDGRALQGDCTLQVSCMCVICVSQVDHLTVTGQECTITEQHDVLQFL